MWSSEYVITPDYTRQKTLRYIRHRVEGWSEIPTSGLKKQTAKCGDGHAAGSDRHPLGAESLSPTTTATEFCQQPTSLEDPEPHVTTALLTP